MKRLKKISGVMATHDGLHDVVVNLILDATDAMPEGGVMTVTTHAEDDGVRFMFRDTGVGMSEQTASRVFEAFSTTKEDVGSRARQVHARLG